ncbi:MAG TPA: cation:proton antiporter [Candidatus Tectomicrobia bacterium]|nr:cation:proton antiporter [Candidatus Tectomicrobia bacterium]
MENIWFIAAAWMAMALIASVISIRLGISVALIEMFVGVIAGNFLGFHTTPWIDFLATFGSGLLTFLAGAEIDPASLRKHLKSSLMIGSISFLLPFLGAMAFAYYVIGWDLRAAQITGIALSTTSVAVVYAVMVEGGLSNTDLGKLILAACFVTDLGTVVALGVLFASFNMWMGVFIAVTALVLWKLQSVTRWVISNWGSRVSEPEVKFIFLVLFFLGGLSTTAKSEAVLPAYLVGLVIAGVFVRDRVLVQRMRSIAFTMLTPFFFIKAGTFVSLSALLAGLGLIVVLLGVKIATKFVGVWPLTRVFRMSTRESHYTTLLMSTGLTFGSISALYGLTNGIIDQRQYTILVTVVVGSAFVPTIIAQTWFQPEQTLGLATDSAEVANIIDQDHEYPLETASREPVGEPKSSSGTGQR